MGDEDKMAVAEVLAGRLQGWVWNRAPGQKWPEGNKEQKIERERSGDLAKVIKHRLVRFYENAVWTDRYKKETNKVNKYKEQKNKTNPKQ